MATRFWSLGANGLTESQPRIAGTLSLSDLAGREWVLVQLSRSDQAPTEPEVTLILEGDRFTGESGCNRYFVEPEAGPDPGELSVGPIGATRMACPEEQMDLENRYLGALGNVTKFGFLNGMLALTWLQDGTTSTMLFKARTI
jgi:heat shock protein HslJ